MTFLANLLNILFVVLAEAYIVEKANKCLDFTVTVFVIHLCFVWYEYKFPWALQWWLTQALIVTVNVLASEFFCMKLETAEIKLSVGHILERGKEIGKEAAQKIMHKTEEISIKKGKDSKMNKRKDKTLSV